MGSKRELFRGIPTPAHCSPSLQSDESDGRRIAKLDRIHTYRMITRVSKRIRRMPPVPGRNTLLRQWTGPLTRELVQRPGDFGLGHLPSRLQPDATTTVVCGFCSTGCGLNV